MKSDIIVFVNRGWLGHRSSFVLPFVVSYVLGVNHWNCTACVHWEIITNLFARSWRWLHLIRVVTYNSLFYLIPLLLQPIATNSFDKGESIWSQAQWSSCHHHLILLIIHLLLIILLLLHVHWWQNDTLVLVLILVLVLVMLYWTLLLIFVLLLEFFEAYIAIILLHGLAIWLILIVELNLAVDIENLVL